MTEIELLEQELLKPSDALIADVAALEGDIILLGVGGKMGPSLAKLARQAVDMAGVKKRVMGVSLFSDAKTQAALEANGIPMHHSPISYSVTRASPLEK